MKRGPVFEVKLNAGKRWFWHERAVNGQVVGTAQAYASKSNAVRAARRKVATTPSSTLRVID